jgi:hypothetical protein
MGLMRLTRAAVLVAGAAFAGAGLAQFQVVPAEIPPASYQSDQYIDSRGCAFVRVGVGRNIDWVPRVGRDREQICGLTPTGAMGADGAAAPALRVTGTAPVVRSVATTPRPAATRPRAVATTPRPMPQAAAPVPGDAARGLAGNSAGQGGSALREVVRHEVNPPAGYRAAWDDGRMNPYRGLGGTSGQRQMEQVWTNSVPRRLVVQDPRGRDAQSTRPSRPADLTPAQVVVIRP